MNDLAKSVKHIMVVFLFCFIALISYMTYFQIFKAPELANDSGNLRLWAKRNEVLRGTIYDRDQNPLTKSERKDTLTQKREYVDGELYANILGYCDERYGITGLEKSFDTELSNYNSFSTGLRNLFKDFDLKKLKEEWKGEEDKKVGNGIVTTLDPNIQKVAFDALGDNKGAVVALDPKTGEVLAMVSKPTYNPNNLEAAMNEANASDGSDSKLINRAINGTYPPGSIFKTITAAAALETDPAVATKTFNDTGKISFPDGTSLNNYGNEVLGNINLKEAYRLSSNAVFGQLAIDMGNTTLKEYAEKFGFNSRMPGIGLDISQSIFPTLQDYQKGEIAQTGIGQGAVLTTPMEMALMAATVANDGVLMQPKLVNKVVDKDGNTVEEIQNKVLKSDVIKPETATTLRDYMGNLVQKNLYRWPDLNGTNAGGKTGTADYTLPNGELAVPHGWFVAVAPLDNPQVAVAVIVENGGLGATKAADVASKVVREAVLGN